MFGNARKQPVDPSYTLPAGRRVIWEHGQDLAVYLSISLALNVLFALAVLIMSMVLIGIYSKPPNVLTYDQGYVFYRGTDVYKLRTDMIATYLNVTTGTLLTINPGGYDVSKLDGLVASRISAMFANKFKQEQDAILATNRRELWRIQKIKRYYDPNLPNYIQIAIMGEKVKYEDIRTNSGLTDLKTTNLRTLYIVYLAQVTPTAQNPWGLFLDGIQEISPNPDPDKPKAIWDKCVDLAGTKDLQGVVIKDPPKDPRPQ